VPESPEFYQDPPEIQLEQKALALSNDVNSLKVFDQPSLSRAHDVLVAAKSFLRALDEEFDPLIKEAHDHHKNLLAKKRKFAEPAQRDLSKLNEMITDYMVEQDRIRFEAEQASERAKVAAAKLAEKASNEAFELAKNGEISEAEALVSKASEEVQAIQEAAPPVPEKPIADGSYLRETWDFAIENEELIPRKYLVPDLVKIRRYGQNMKHQAVIPGVRFFTKKSLSTKIG